LIDEIALNAMMRELALFGCKPSSSERRVREEESANDGNSL
jgi:hypothetical protein